MKKVKQEILSGVYLITDLQSNAVKIGESSDIYDRLKTLQTGNPNVLELLHYFLCSDTRLRQRLEKKYQKRMYHLQIRDSEWYTYNKEEFDKLIINPINIQPKKTREPIVTDTIFGTEKFDASMFPRCHYYPEYPAQIKVSYEEAVKMILKRQNPFRTEEIDTKGKRMLGRFSNKVNRVFISEKRHKENLEAKRFKKQKQLSNIETNGELLVFLIN
jgi:hypothetical protein